jgi:transcriptional regulator, TetR family
MQTLKDDIRQRIIATARAEFIAHGVRCTSIRTMARKSGVAVGNLYNYFKSKDELFCEVLRPLTKALNKHILSHNDEKFLSIDVFNMRQHQIDYIFAMLAIIKDFRPELRLLLFNSEGTSLQGYKDKMVDRQMKVGMEYLRLMKERYPHLNANISPFLVHIICSTWITAFCEIVEHEDYSDEDIKVAMEQYMDFSMAGWKALLKP